MNIPADEKLDHICYIVVQETFSPQKTGPVNVRAFADYNKAVKFAKDLFGNDLDGYFDDYKAKGISARQKVSISHIPLDLA